MNKREIFERLFSIFGESDDVNGVVAACIVREGKILFEAVSNNNGVHAEYALLRKLEESGGRIQKGDSVYCTVEPCGMRSPGGRGEKMGDCTSNLIKAGVSHIVFAAPDPHASGDTRKRFKDAGIELVQVSDRDIIDKAIRMFNDSCRNKEDWLPLSLSRD